MDAVCLDDIIKVHDTYLNEIFLRALQSEQHENLNTQVSYRRRDTLSRFDRFNTSFKQSSAFAI